jgi:two-component system chemotaxis sensor kinase CheA
MSALDDLIQAFLSSLPDRVVEATNLWLEFEEGKLKDLVSLKRLLHTVKGEAHMLSLEAIGDHVELLEDLVVLVHDTGQRTDNTGNAVLESLELMVLLGPDGAGEEGERVTRDLRAACDELRGLAPAAKQPQKAATEARAPSVRPPLFEEIGTQTHALPEEGPAPEGAAERRADNTMRIEEVQPSVYELRRLHEEQLMLQPRLREVQRILRAVVAEMDPSLPPAVLGEQVIKTLGMTAELERRISTIRTEWAANAFATGIAIEQLGETAQRAAMISVHRLRSALERSTRRTARDLGKEVQLRLEGDAYLDAAIAQRLEPALIHAVRNAVDHGIEAPEAREAHGKPRRGTIDIRVEQHVATVRVVVTDDGAGVDVERVRKRYNLDPSLPERSVLRTLLKSGVSTRDVATSISGRGVGLDVVARETLAVGGTIELETQLGKGFRISLTLPTLLRADLIVPIECGSHQLALPTRNVETIVRLQEVQTTTEGAYARVEHDGRSDLLPVYALASLFGEAESVEKGNRAVLIRHGEARYLLTVDGHGNPRPLPFQPASELAFRSPLVTAVAPSPEGLRILLDVAQLTEQLQGTRTRTAEVGQKRALKVVVVEDAPVARELLCGILRSFGLQVTEAAHGAEGLLRIRDIGPDLVLTDVEMPFLGGLEMVRELRSEKRFADLPVIVLTTDTREATRNRAKALHVVGFLSKQKFVETELRQLVDRCLEGRT